MKDFLKSPIDNMSLNSLIIAYGNACRAQAQYLSDSAIKNRFAQEEAELFKRILKIIQNPEAE